MNHFQLGQDNSLECNICKLYGSLYNRQTFGEQLNALQVQPSVELGVGPTTQHSEVLKIVLTLASGCLAAGNLPFALAGENCKHPS